MSLRVEARALWGDVDRLEVTSLPHNRANGVTRSVDRVRTGGRSAVVKVLGRHTERVPTHWLPSDDPTHFNYWRREALAYGAGLADAYAGSGLVAPDLLALHHREDGSIALWLEDFGSDDTEWTVDDVVEIARRLGVAQGRIAVEGGPDHGWLSRRFLRRSSSAKPIDAKPASSSKSIRVVRNMLSYCNCYRDSASSFRAARRLCGCNWPRAAGRLELATTNATNLIR